MITKMSRHKPDWSELHPELLVSISDRLETRSDISHFRSVCRNWHSSVPKLPSKLPILFHNFPLNFPYKLSRTTPPDDYTLFVVANATFTILPKTPGPALKPWLITVEEFNPGKLLLRSPLTRRVISKLPDGFPKDFVVNEYNVREIRRDFSMRFVGVGGDREDDFYRCWGRSIDDKLLLFFNPNRQHGLVNDCYALSLHDKGTLLYVRLNIGGKKKKGNKCGYLRHSRVSCFDDAVNYKGGVWVIDRKGRVYVVRFSSHHLELTMFCKDGVCTGYVGDTRKRLVESEEGLYLIDRYHYDELIKFKVYKLNEVDCKWDEIKSLDDQILFVSTDSCFFVSSEEFGGCGKNCVFFPKDHFPTYSDSTHPDYFYFKGATEELEIGVFHLDDGESGLVSAYRGYSRIFWPPPKWIFPGWDGAEEEEAPEELCNEEMVVSPLGIEAYDFFTMNGQEQDGDLDLPIVDVPWSDIPSKLLSEIGKHLKDRIDVYRFRSVCKKWEASLPPPPIPNLLCSMLPHQILTPGAPFANVDRSSGTVNRLSLVASTIYLVRPSAPSVIPSKSWLVTVEELNPGKLFLRLPLRTAALKQLPENFPKAVGLSDLRVKEICKEYKFRYTNTRWRMYWSCNPYSPGGQKVTLFPNRASTPPSIDDTTALVLYCSGSLASCRLSDEVWLPVRCGAVTKFDDIVNFKGQAYAIDRKGRLYVISRDTSKAVRISNEIMGTGAGPDRQKRLVECDGRLLLVVRFSPADKIFFRIYELGEEQLKWLEVRSLGDKILFVTPSICFVASARDCPGWKSNCIVFPADCMPTYSGSTYPDWRFFRRTVKELEIGVYYLGEIIGARLIKSYPGYSDLFWPPPAWLEPLAVEPVVVNSSITAEEEIALVKVTESCLKSKITSLVQGSEDAVLTAKFQGLDVRSEFLPILKKIWGKYGNIAQESASSRVFEYLAQVVLFLTSTPGKSLKESEAFDIKAIFRLLHALHFKVDWLAPFVDKAFVCYESNTLAECMEENEKMKAQIQDLRNGGFELERFAEIEQKLEDWKKSLTEKINALGSVDLERCLGQDLF